MKVTLKLTASTNSVDIDLEQYGHEGKSWNDLTEDEQNEIRDSISENNWIEVCFHSERE